MMKITDILGEAGRLYKDVREFRKCNITTIKDNKFSYLGTLNGKYTRIDKSKLSSE